MNTSAVNRHFAIAAAFLGAVWLGTPLLNAQSAASKLPDMSAAEIIGRVDENTVFKTVSYSGTMEIDMGKRVLRKAMTAVAEGSSTAFIEFTNPEDRGIRYLKIDKSLWMFFPEEQETIKISGHLLKEGMMGSDLSYEDALESDSLLDKYELSVAGREDLDGRPCYILDLTAKLKNAPYDRQKMWIDGERFVALKTEMYAKAGKLLKESRALEVKRYGERWFATKLVMEDKLKQGSGTTMTMTDMEFDVELPADQFSLRRLSR